MTEQVYCVTHNYGPGSKEGIVMQEHKTKDCKLVAYKPENHIKGYNDAKIKEQSGYKKPIVPKSKGVSDNVYFESIILDNKPCFLCVDQNGAITTTLTIDAEDRTYRPLQADEYGYIPYKFDDSELEHLLESKQSREEILSDIKSCIDRYVVARDLDKNLILGNIFLTYCQESLNTVHFPFFVGETESGKSSVLHLGKWLNYRCLYGEDIPHADIYNFLGSEEEGTGTICEDEAQELLSDREKIRTYKNSYSKGSVKPRIVSTSHSKRQVFYKTFCPKWFAGERVPQDKGFLERLAIVYMMEGEPQRNIKRVDKSEIQNLNRLRNNLLIYKIQNLGKEFQRIDSGLRGRDQELWEDFLSTAHSTKFHDGFKKVVTWYTRQRHDAIKNSIEAKLFKLAIDKMDEKYTLVFTEYWDYIVHSNSHLPGSLDERGSKTFHPEDYGTKINHQYLAKLLEYKFQGTKLQRNYRDEDKTKHQVTYYTFKKEALLKLVRKYGTDVPIDNPLYVHELGELCEPVDQVDLVDQHKQGLLDYHVICYYNHSRRPQK